MEFCYCDCHSKFEESGGGNSVVIKNIKVCDECKNIECVATKDHITWWNPSPAERDLNKRLKVIEDWLRLSEGAH